MARGLIDGATAAAYEDPDLDVSCTAGCGACCSQAVPATAAEIRSIHEHLDGLEPEQRKFFRDRITSAAATLAAAGVTPTDPGDPREYFSLNVPCAFLVDGSCGIRPVRPLICREYLVTSDPEHCSPFSQEQAVRIRSDRDVHRGFVKVSHAFGEEQRFILAAAMAEPIPTQPASSPKSGPVMSRMIISTVRAQRNTKARKEL